MSHRSVPDTRNVNSLWAGVIVETLARCGVTRAVVSPGSRSTPLTLAVAAHAGIEAIPVLDERSAAFFALGLAKQDLQPVVLLCTSGTAAANFLPAIVEAHESAVPLIVLTADRPPEMRACASGQTIDQQKLFGGYVQFYHEVATPENDEARLRYLRQTVAHVVARSRPPAGGPVHLNVPFRDPLVPAADDGATETFARGIDWDLFFSHVVAEEVVSLVRPLPVIMPEVHGAIVVGPAQPGDPAAYVAAVAEIARRLGWPVLADGLSPLRNHVTQLPHLVATYDLILRNAAAAERLKPEVVLCLGEWPTSKVLRAWIERSAATIWLATERPDNRDALHGRTRTLAVSLPTLAALLPEAIDPNGYQRMWARYEHKVRPLIFSRLQAEAALFEPKAAWLLGRALPPGTPIFISNSMPVRDVEYVWPAGDRAIRPFCNRGANGIDGTLSTALGVAHGGSQPAVLLTGDLALLHDTNGFLLCGKFRGSLTIVLINNRGGGIFEHLPVAAYEPPFEEFFATPQEADFAKLCAAYGVEHTLVRDWVHFAELVRTLPASGVRVIEVRTDRKHDAAARKALFAEWARALE
ncbi:2-succinyl-5-enolpyruvyl-6-hydroxy-3-cyclohexene-1-carboxylic-acid synthase [Horticoccus sp. 23ND18S-11]|uniref:2-succinyl-5-enolpyruvyl-6-hydroxy-3- cyclohexene-1-carboxylic-acid synthase n=1 Tax=Horticoccus sp. 23ND18S-11 TaxID=3391832 RepID=UPI0039C92754